MWSCYIATWDTFACHEIFLLSQNTWRHYHLIILFSFSFDKIFSIFQFDFFSRRRWERRWRQVTETKNLKIKKFKFFPKHKAFFGFVPLPTWCPFWGPCWRVSRARLIPSPPKKCHHCALGANSVAWRKNKHVLNKFGDWRGHIVIERCAHTYFLYGFITFFCTKCFKYTNENIFLFRL